MSCICLPTRRASSKGSSYGKVSTEPEPDGDESDQDEADANDLLHARISALEEMWSSAREEVDALHAQLNQAEAARSVLEAAAAREARAAALAPRPDKLSPASIKQLALERLSQARGLTMDELRVFKDAATPEQLEQLKVDLRVCVAALQQEDAARTNPPALPPPPSPGNDSSFVATPSDTSASDSAKELAAVRSQLERAVSVVCSERARRAAAEADTAKAKDMLINASGRMKVLTAEKLGVARQLEILQAATGGLTRSDAGSAPESPATSEAASEAASEREVASEPKPELEPEPEPELEPETETEPRSTGRSEAGAAASSGQAMELELEAAHRDAAIARARHKASADGQRQLQDSLTQLQRQLAVAEAERAGTLADADRQASAAAAAFSTAMGQAEEEATGVLAARLGVEEQRHQVERAVLAERCDAQEARVRSLTDQLDASVTAAAHGRDAVLVELREENEAAVAVG